MIVIEKLNNIFHKHIVQCVLLFVLLALLASVFVNMPLGEIDKKMPDQIDTYLVSWVWSWELHALITDPLNFFQANIFAPFNNTLVFTETMIGTALFAWPILLLSHNNAALAYNLVVLITFAISGLGMYLLTFYLTKNKWASLLAALVYTFAPFKLIHGISHLHITGMWLPYVFLYAHKFFEKQTWKNVLLLTLFIILVFLEGFHYFIFLPIVIIVFTVTYLLTKQFEFNRDNIKKIVLSLLVCAIITMPIIMPYLQVRKEYDQTRLIKEIEVYSPDLIDYFISPVFYKYFYPTRSHTEMAVCPGLMSMILFLLSIYILKHNLFSNEKKYFLIYSITALIAFLISFGFYIQFTSADQTGMLGPFALFYYFMPGFDGIRAAGRYSIFVLLTISIFIGWGASIWHIRITSVFKKILLYFLIITFLFLEFAFVPPVSYSANKIVSGNTELTCWMANQSDDKIFLHLPMAVDIDSFINYDISYVYNSRDHFKKIVNGYSGYSSPGYLELAKKLLSFEPDKDIDMIKKFKVNYIIFHFDSYRNPEKIKNEVIGATRDNNHFKYITNFDNNYIYQVIYE